MLWLWAATVPLILVASMATCLARPDWVRGLRSYVARVRWARFQYSIKRGNSSTWPKARIETLFREYYVHKGGGEPTAQERCTLSAWVSRLSPA
jgi:uncharacterized protein (UPF0303 family)